MKTTRTHGMRDIPTIQGLRAQAQPATREQAVTEFARLEHEKARLERELEMWQKNEKKTQDRLLRLQQRLVLIQEIINPPGAEAASGPTPGRRTATRSEGGAEKTHNWKEVKLEY
jgi:hypothetical protein